MAKSIEEAQDAYKAARRELIAATQAKIIAEDALEAAQSRLGNADRLAQEARVELDAAIDAHSDQLALELPTYGQA